MCNGTFCHSLKMCDHTFFRSLKMCQKMCHCTFALSKRANVHKCAKNGQISKLHFFAQKRAIAHFQNVPLPNPGEELWIEPISGAVGHKTLGNNNMGHKTLGDNNMGHKTPGDYTIPRQQQCGWVIVNLPSIVKYTVRVSHHASTHFNM